MQVSSLSHSVQSGVLRACERWPLYNRLEYSAHGMAEWETGEWKEKRFIQFQLVRTYRTVVLVAWQL